MQQRLHGVDLGAVIVGVIIVGVGAYYLLDRTLGINLPDLDWDRIWPLAVIALGLGILYSAWTRVRRGGHGPQGT